MVTGECILGDGLGHRDLDALALCQKHRTGESGAGQLDSAAWRGLFVALTGVLAATLGSNEVVQAAMRDSRLPPEMFSSNNECSSQNEY